MTPSSTLPAVYVGTWIALEETATPYETIEIALYGSGGERRDGAGLAEVFTLRVLVV